MSGEIVPKKASALMQRMAVMEQRAAGKGATVTTKVGIAEQNDAAPKGRPLPKETADRLKNEAFEIALQLPLFPEQSSAMPHHWTRTTLFSSFQAGARRTFQEERLSSRADFEVLYTGPQLDMADNDVFLHVVQMAQNQPADSIITFTRSRFLKAIGRVDEGKKTYKWLETSLRRLASATLFVENSEGHGRMFRLIREMAWDTSAGRSWVQLDPRIVEFFQVSQLAFIDFEARLKLGTPLAKWLQNYACGHRAGEWHHVTVENLRVWSGGGLMRNFLAKGRGLRAALSELEEAGIIDESEIYAGTVNGEKVKMVRWWRPSGAAKWLREYAQNQAPGWHKVSVETLFGLSQYRTLKGFLTPGKGLPKMLSELEKGGAISKPEIYTDSSNDKAAVKMVRWYREPGQVLEGAAL